MTYFVCLLIFLRLTTEGTDFAYDGWHTFMVHTRPLFHGNPVNAWDVALGLAAVVAAVRPSRPQGRARPLEVALLVSLCAVLALLIWGGVRGGDLRLAYFQLAGLLRMYVLAFVLLRFLRTPRDVRILALTILGAALYRAVACIICFHTFTKVGGLGFWPEYVTTHDDSALWATAGLGLLSWVLVSRTLGAVLIASPLGLVVGLAIHYNDRRLAWVQVVGGLLLVYLLAPRRKKLDRYLAVATPFLILYCIVGWERQGNIFAPVAQIRSLLSSEDDMSNQARDLENIGLVVTLQSNRLLGTGFGHPYHEVATVYTQGMATHFSNYRYNPHNSVLGLAAFTGLVGLPLIWSIMPIGAFLAARASRVSRRPGEGALAATAFVVPFVYSVQAFGDVGLHAIVPNVILACGLATAGSLAVQTGAWSGRSGGRRGRVPRPGVEV